MLQMALYKAEIVSRYCFYNLNKSIVQTELKVFIFYYIQRVRRWRSSLRHCSRRRKNAGSISDGVLGIIFIHIILCSTEPETKICARNVSWGIKAAGA